MKKTSVSDPDPLFFNGSGSEGSKNNGTGRIRIRNTAVFLMTLNNEHLIYLPKEYSENRKEEWR